MLIDINCFKADEDVNCYKDEKRRWLYGLNLRHCSKIRPQLLLTLFVLQATCWGGGFFDRQRTARVVDCLSVFLNCLQKRESKWWCLLLIWNSISLQNLHESWWDGWDPCCDEICREFTNLWFACLAADGRGSPLTFTPKYELRWW